MQFIKMQGCGNDYIFVNCTYEKLSNPEIIAKKVSDRHFGIGADGLILIENSIVADFAMRMFNVDGSEGEMCGNAVRCIGKYVYENKMTDKKLITLETKAGIREIKLEVKDKKVTKIIVDMGKVILEPKKIPVKSELKKLINHKIVIDKKELYMTCVSLGNPHAVFFTDNLLNIQLSKIGKKIENNKIFPNRINVEFVQVLSKDRIRMRVWERGSGETLACGTGACAAAVACVINNKTNNKVEVVLNGGVLLIEYDRVLEKVFMTGSADFVFCGYIDEKSICIQ